MRRQIGIALMCDQRGLPLRWKTLPGNHDEAKSMMSMVDDVLSAGWAERVPLVVDRAMGRGVTIEKLLARDVPFVTAVPSHEIRSYSTRIPLSAFDDVKLGDGDRGDEAVLQELGSVAVDAGFKKCSPNRYVLELGVFSKGEGELARVASWLCPSRATAALRLALRVRAELDGDASQSDIAARYGRTERELRRWMELLSLEEELRRRILAGEADRLTPSALRAIARLPADGQAAAFDHARQVAGEGEPLRATNRAAQLLNVPFLQVRATVLFNPSRWIEQRRAAARVVAELQQTRDVINERLRSPRSQRTREMAAARMLSAIKHRDLMDVYKVEIDHVQVDGRSVPQVQLVHDTAAWERRRRTDGITLVVAHPDLQESGEELVQLYFAKDQVEKDFQAIKSVLALRPVYHQTDPKVRAHVSLCMLALLIERTIELRLRDAGSRLTALDALHRLRSCHLNVFGGDPAAYSVTEADSDQCRITAALGLKELLDDAALAEILTPR